MEFKPMALSQNIFQLMKYHESLKYSGFGGIQTHENMFQLLKYQRRKPLKYERRGGPLEYQSRKPTTF